MRGSKKKRGDSDSIHGSSPATPQKSLLPADEADETWEYVDGGKKASIAMGVTCDDAKEDRAERDPLIPAAAITHSRSPRDRRPAISARHSQVKLGTAEASSSPAADDLSAAPAQEGEDQLSQLYMVFRKCAEVRKQSGPERQVHVIRSVSVMSRPTEARL